MTTIPFYLNLINKIIATVLVCAFSVNSVSFASDGGGIIAVSLNEVPQKEFLHEMDKRFHAKLAKANPYAAQVITELDQDEVVSDLLAAVVLSNITKDEARAAITSHLKHNDTGVADALLTKLKDMDLVSMAREPGNQGAQPDKSNQVRNVRLDAENFYETLPSISGAEDVAPEGKARLTQRRPETPPPGMGGTAPKYSTGYGSGPDTDRGEELEKRREQPQAQAAAKTPSQGLFKDIVPLTAIIRAYGYYWETCRCNILTTDGILHNIRY